MQYIVCVQTKKVFYACTDYLVVMLKHFLSGKNLILSYIEQNSLLWLIKLNLIIPIILYILPCNAKSTRN